MLKHFSVCIILYLIQYYHLTDMNQRLIASRSGQITTGLFGWMHASGVGELNDVGPSDLLAVDMCKSLSSFCS